ncbi:uncharacterized protein EAE97_005055 [Botrytis byssoidea]|uniref:Uncharacterized protein n=1 Tax=Botrytis byssoidea TaxID=139641 RepID=A0A9P5ILQ9_9HELO|nr:uncharacterized protein EAE97_005055 [Botrytis byssoidea]KAF7946017.1 hypothetical protein EAE97_005055 [Botrytis byssoidea]
MVSRYRGFGTDLGKKIDWPIHMHLLYLAILYPTDPITSAINSSIVCLFWGISSDVLVIFGTILFGVINLALALMAALRTVEIERDRRM